MISKQESRLLFIVGITFCICAIYAHGADSDEWVGEVPGRKESRNDGENIQRAGRQERGEEGRGTVSESGVNKYGIKVEKGNKVEFSLEQMFGDEDGGYSSAGVFSSSVLTIQGSKVLVETSLRRPPLTAAQHKYLLKLATSEGFYHLRVPANILRPSKNFVYSSVKANCLFASSFRETVEIVTDGTGNIIGINFIPMTAGACHTPPSLLSLEELPRFNSTVICNVGSHVSPILSKASVISKPTGEEGKAKEPPKTFWQKNWMYVIPIALIFVNALLSAGMQEPSSGGAGGR